MQVKIRVRFFFYRNINIFVKGCLLQQAVVVDMLTFSSALHLNDIEILIWTSV